MGVLTSSCTCRLCPDGLSLTAVAAAAAVYAARLHVLSLLLLLPLLISGWELLLTRPSQ